MLARYVASPAFADGLLAGEPHLVNTDDRTWIEFAFARSLGGEHAPAVEELREQAREAGHHRFAAGGFDWASADAAWAAVYLADGTWPEEPPAPHAGDSRARLFVAFARGDHPAALAVYREAPFEPRELAEIAALAWIFAETQAEEAPAMIARVEELLPLEGTTLRAIMLARLGRFAEATDLFVRAFEGYRNRSVAAAAAHGRRDRPGLAGDPRTPGSA